MNRMRVLAVVALTACTGSTTTGEVPPAEPAPDPAPAHAAQEPAPTQATPRVEAQTTPPVEAPSPTARLDYERNTIEVFRAVAPATVFITETRVVRDPWSWRASEVEAGTGSGFVWDDRGHIVTNFHVIAEGTRFEVTLFDGSDHPARLVGADPTKDIAVLAIDTSNAQLRPVRRASKDLLEVGQKTIAIGNPFGLDHTLTVGVISAVGREVLGIGGVTIRDMIQTDASINPGNSGGPLLDSSGALIGMNTMIYSKTGSSAGIGFAVPASTIERVVPQIIAHGHPIYAGIGVELVPDRVAQRNGINGVAIASVARDSPAARAGLRGLQRSRRAILLGDVIVGVDGRTVTDYDTWFNALDRREPGDRVTLRVVRNTDRFEVEIELVAEAIDAPQ